MKILLTDIGGTCADAINDHCRKEGMVTIAVHDRDEVLSMLSGGEGRGERDGFEKKTGCG